MQAHWEIAKADDGWRLLRNGEPFYIQGAVAGGHLDALAAAGATALRVPPRQETLDRAAELGLVALVNLPVRGERDGVNWDDEARVAAQRREVLDVVASLKRHPAVMMWAVGNELDWIPPGRPHSPRLWQRLNDLAREIHRADPHHPVCTVVGTGTFEQKVQQMARECPDFDLLGINAYGDIAQVAESARQHWPKPYVIAEWGPTGHWQVPRTTWRAPLEQTSSEKAHTIYERYTNVILADRAHCLGAFVFYWAEKQETTHTWYGLLRDGMKTESIDVMARFWTGAWPENRAPAVLGLTIAGVADPTNARLAPGSAHQAQVICFDPDHDPLTIAWDIRPEVQIPAGSYAGSLEKRAQPIAGLIEEPQGTAVRFTSPHTEGAYRLFVQVTDGNGHAGYANVPFHVAPQPDRAAAP